MTANPDPRQETKNALASTLETLVIQLEHPVYRKQILPGISTHHESGPVSVRSIINILHSQGLRASDSVVSLGQLSEISMPCLTFVWETINGVKRECLVLFVGIKRNKARYFHPRLGRINEDLGDFSQKWNNRIIMVVKAEQPGS